MRDLFRHRLYSATTTHTLRTDQATGRMSFTTRRIAADGEIAVFGIAEQRIQLDIVILAQLTGDAGVVPIEEVSEHITARYRYVPVAPASDGIAIGVERALARPA